MDLARNPPPALIRVFSLIFDGRIFGIILINKLKIRILYKISTGIGFTPPPPPRIIRVKRSDVDLGCRA